MRITRTSIALALILVVSFIAISAEPATLVASNGGADQLTVRARITIDQANLPSSGAIGLIGMSADAGSSDPFVSLQLMNVSRGWFGSSWTLQLVGDSSVLSGPITLLDSPELSRDGDYELTFGYDAATGIAYIALYVPGNTEPLVAAQKRLVASDTLLYPWVPEVKADSSSAIRIAEVEHIPHAIPFGLAWHVTQQTSAPVAMPTDRLNRQLPAMFELDAPDALGNLTDGKLTLHITSDDGAVPVVVWPINIGQNNILPVSTLPVGTYTFALQYTVDGAAFTLSERQITVGVASLRLGELQAERVGDVFRVGGQVIVEADGPLPPLDVTVLGDLIAHVPGEARGRIVLSDRLIFDQPISPKAGLSAIPFAAEVSLPAGDATPFWELRLQPAVRSDTHLADFDPSVSAWIASTTEARPLEGFLEDEVIAHKSIVPGIDLYTIRGRLASEPIEMYLVKADLSSPHVSVDAIIPHYPTWNLPQWPRAHVSEMTRHAGAVVGINAAFFEISSTMMPRGTEIRSNELVTSAIAGWEGLIGFTEDGAPYIGDWRWTGGIRRPDGTAFRPASGFNVLQRQNNRLFIHSSPPPMKSPGTDSGLPDVVELVIKIESIEDSAVRNERIVRGEVKEVRHRQPGVSIDHGFIVVTGYGDAADYLIDTFDEGDAIEVFWNLSGRMEWPYLDDWHELRAAVPTGIVLLRNGTYGDLGVRSDPNRHPRTAVGVTWDQSTMYWLVVDGRSDQSVGMTYKEMADFFIHIGVFHAVNLDGGGSSTLVIADPETGRVTSVNRPSDGGERLVPDGLGLFYNPTGE